MAGAGGHIGEVLDRRRVVRGGNLGHDLPFGGKIGCGLGGR